MDKHHHQPHRSSSNSSSCCSDCILPAKLFDRRVSVRANLILISIHFLKSYVSIALELHALTQNSTRLISDKRHLTFKRFSSEIILINDDDTALAIYVGPYSVVSDKFHW